MLFRSEDFVEMRADYAYNGSEGEATLRTRTATREGPRCENEVMQEKGVLRRRPSKTSLTGAKRLQLELRYI